MSRQQFRLKSLLWLTLAVAMFLGGMVIQRQIAGYQATRREKELQELVQQLRQEVRNRVNEARELEGQAFALQKKLKAMQEEANHSPGQKE